MLAILDSDMGMRGVLAEGVGIAAAFERDGEVIGGHAEATCSAGGFGLFDVQPGTNPDGADGFGAVVIHGWLGLGSQGDGSAFDAGELLGNGEANDGR